MNCNRNCLYQKNGLCNLKLSNSDAENRCPLMPDDALPDEPYKPPMTNADRIRGMSDEELCFLFVNTERFANLINVSYAEMMDWLRQPAGGEQHGV